MTELANKHCKTLPDLAYGFELGAIKVKKYIAKALIGDYLLADACMLIIIYFMKMVLIIYFSFTSTVKTQIL